MRPLPRSDPRPYLAACVLALAVGLVFWGPAFAAGRGYFPAPLDDVYIHFDFARSLARGHGFEWSPGNGYSSGETAPLYALVLALGWLVGFHDRALGFFAAGVAVLAVGSFVRSVQRLVRPCPPALRALLACFVLSVGVLDWSLFSGMEVAVFAAVLGRTLEALALTREPIDGRAGRTRERTQWTLGVWGAALVLVRPEAGVLVAIFGVTAARGAGARSALAALARASLPGAVATGAVLVTNRVFTGESQSAGALLKLLSSNPYLSDVDRARVYVENLVTFGLKGVRGELAALPVAGALVPLLALLGLVAPARRPAAAACLLGALAWALVVSSNGNAPHHNFRYYAPVWLLLLVSGAHGVATLARAARGRRGTLTAAAACLLATVTCGLRLPVQSDFFRRAAANIRDQQIEVGERLAARLGPRERVMVGDAGAIPFVAQRPALDAMGLGGYRGLPFARAAASGEASIVELLERLPVAERPAYLALYPNWFATLTRTFGTEVDRVTLTDNVICAGAAKVIYRADWSALAPPSEVDEDVLDEIDVADPVSERAHGYVSPAPEGGWTVLQVLADPAGRGRFDGGRIIPAGKTETFTLNRDAGGGAMVVVRVDDGARGLVLHAPRGDVALELDEPVRGAWQYARGRVAARAGERLVLTSSSGHRDYHVWIRAR
ncbi:MAG: hypothetical protein JWP97_6070 [Labilithrix sp.]|nr:hypothetical protein [Labilithrix sp.]